MQRWRAVLFMLSVLMLFRLTCIWCITVYLSHLDLPVSPLLYAAARLFLESQLYEYKKSSRKSLRQFTAHDAKHINMGKQASHWLWGSAGLKMPVYAHFRWIIFSRNVGQTDLDFCLWSGFVFRSVRPTLQVSVCSDYDLCHPG